VNNVGNQYTIAETYQFQDTQNSIDMPALVRSKAFSGKANLSSHTEFKFVIRNFKERKQFANENADVLLIDKCI
jgi:hypothetical protein